MIEFVITCAVVVVFIFVSRSIGYNRGFNDGYIIGNVDGRNNTIAGSRRNDDA